MIKSDCPEFRRRLPQKKRLPRVQGVAMTVQEVTACSSRRTLRGRIASYASEATYWNSYHDCS